MKKRLIISALLFLLKVSVFAQSSVFNAREHFELLLNRKVILRISEVDFDLIFFIPKENKFSFGAYGDFLSYNVNKKLENYIEKPSDYFEKTIGKYSSICLGTGINRLIPLGESPFSFCFGATTGLNLTSRNAFKTNFLNEDGTMTTIEVYKQGNFKSIGFFIAPYAEVVMRIKDFFGLHFGTNFSYRYSNFGSILKIERLGEISSSTIREKFHILDVGIYFGFSLDIGSW